jgi:hypothetical protein
MNNKYSDPFFIGLALIIISAFFTLFNIKIKEGPGMPVVLTMKTSLGNTGVFGKFDMKTPVLDGALHENDRYDDSFRDFDLAKKNASFPRFFRINFFLIMILSVWGLLVFAAQPLMRDSNKKGIFSGIILALVLFFAVLFFEINHYKSILDEFSQINISDYYHIGFGPGFYILIVALLTTLYGTFFYQPAGSIQNTQ